MFRGSDLPSAGSLAVCAARDDKHAVCILPELRRASRRCSFPKIHLRFPRMSSIWDLANSQLRDLAVYEPGKPIEETARELGADAASIIKLASNENPLGPSPKALEALHAALPTAHLYPDGGGYYLGEALAAKLGCAR